MNRSIAIALGLGLALSLYMLTGLIGCGREESSGPQASDDTAPVRLLMTVPVRDMTAEAVHREIVLTGKTAASRGVDLKAETLGQVTKVSDLRGKPVKQGQILAELEMNSRLEYLDQARAALDQARLEYDAALRLQERDLRSASQVAQALSSLKGSEQAIRSIELEIENTRVTAPFDGVLLDRMVELGDYVGIGDPVARLIDLDPLIVQARATEFQVGKIKVGETGHAHLASDRVVDGKIRYVAGEADPVSRTFLIELEIANPDSSIPAGMTAEVRIETDRVFAHRIEQSLISIADDGVLGFKIVDKDNKVRFYPAEILRFETKAILVTNLPENIRLIMEGQGFLKDGDSVHVVPDTDSSN